MKYLKFAAVFAAIPILVCPAQAHHSFAMFDKNRLVTVKGVVSKIEWTNPHVFIFVVAPDGKGVKTQYAVECNSPNVLMRSGWKPSTVKVGDPISIDLYPLRDGQPGALLVGVMLSSGKKIKG